MRVIHRISLQSSRHVRATLARFGIVVPESGFIGFEVDESSDDWPGIKSWIEREDPLDIVTTRFSSEEIAAARWLKLVPDWHRGYPQPEGDRGYLEATYDLTDYCPACGIGRKQRAPFQMRSEPKWGRNAILQLNWVFDEYFVKPEIHASIFKPRGISSRRVTNTKGNQLNTVVQLVIDEEVGIVSDGLAAETCPRCGRPKYLPVTRGPF